MTPLGPALRSLRRSPAFFVTVAGTLGLASALVACTAAVIDGYLLRTMPYAGAKRLYHVRYAEPRQTEPRGLEALSWSALSDVVEVADSSGFARLHLVGDPWRQEMAALRVARGAVRGTTFPITIGRTFGPGDFAAGAEAVMLIGPTLWRDRYRSDPGIVNQTVRIAPASGAGAEQTVRIVGVLSENPRDARTFDRADLEGVVPMRARGTTYLVRLRQGVDAMQAERRIDAAVRAVATALPDGWRGARLESVHTEYVRAARPVLVAVSVAVALVLVVAYANVMVLSLLRAVQRRKEMAVRSALGASRFRLTKLAIAEGVVVATTAMVLGLVVVALALGRLSPLVEARLGRVATAGGISVGGFELLVLLAAGGLTVLAIVIPSLAPLEARLFASLRGSGSGSDTSGARRARQLLVGAQVALSATLLAASGLMIRSVDNLLDVDLGIDPAGVSRSRVSIPARRYASDSAVALFYEQLGLSVAAAGGTPLALSSGTPFYEPARYPVETDGTDSGRPIASVISVTAEYFQAARVPLRQGRYFGREDSRTSEPVTLVSETLARRLWGNSAAVGRRMRHRAQNAVADTAPGPWRIVVGVVGDVRQGVTDANLEDVYLPFAQAPTQYSQLFIRSGQSSEAIAIVRRAASALDGEAMVMAPRSLREEADNALAGPRFLRSLLLSFAVSTIILVGVGVYGVTAFAVQQRRREMAIRLALGATERSVLRLFLSRAGMLLSAGVAVGGVGAVALGRTLASQLYGVSPTDVPTIGVAILVVFAIGLMAATWPVRRGLAASPSAVLKETG